MVFRHVHGGNEHERYDAQLVASHFLVAYQAFYVVQQWYPCQRVDEHLHVVPFSLVDLARLA